MKVSDQPCEWCDATVGKPCRAPVVHRMQELWHEEVPYYHPPRVDAALEALAKRCGGTEGT